MARVTPVVAAGRGAVLVMHDITELRKADLVRRDFVANVSHELRTPLTAIKGYAEALLDDADDAEAREKFLDIIHRHATRMERLVKDLLRLARLDAGQEGVELVPCDVEGLLRGIVNDFEPIAAQKQQTIDTRVAPEAATLMTDAAKLHDIARNLIENAVNYTPDGGAIDVRGGIVERPLPADGVGYRPRHCARRPGAACSSASTASTNRGRGPAAPASGLSIVKHLVQVLDGEVTASNQSGGGALFTVTLPLRPDDSRARLHTELDDALRRQAEVGGGADRRCGTSARTAFAPSAMPSRRDEDGLPSQEGDDVLEVELHAARARQRQRPRHVGILHEAVLQPHVEQAASQVLDEHALVGLGSEAAGR